MSSAGPDCPVVHKEVFGPESISGVGSVYGRPLLLNHDAGRPIGRIQLSRSTDVALEIEAQLIGSDQELEGIRRRLAAGLQSGLSVGSFVDRKSDLWVKPETQDGLSLVLRRNVELRELSLVMWPAFVTAQVAAVTDRTSVAERRRQESERVIAEMRVFTAEVAARRAERRSG